MKKKLIALLLLGLILLSSCTNPDITLPSQSTEPIASSTPAATIKDSTDPLWNNTDITEKTFEGLTIGNYVNRIFVKMTKSGEFEFNMIYSDFENVNPPEGSDLTAPLDCQIRYIMFYKGTYKFENGQYICTLDGDELARTELQGTDAEKYKTAFLEYAKENEPNFYEKYKSMMESYLVYDENDSSLVLTAVPTKDSLAIIRMEEVKDGFKIEAVDYDLKGTPISETTYGKNNEVEYIDYFSKNTVDEQNYTKLTTRKDKDGNVIFVQEDVYAPDSHITTKKDADGNDISKREEITNENRVNITTYFVKYEDGSIYESISLVDDFQTEYYKLEKTTKDGKIIEYHYRHNERDALDFISPTTKSTTITYNDQTKGCYIIDITTYNYDPLPGESQELTVNHSIPASEFNPSDWQSEPMK